MEMFNNQQIRHTFFYVIAQKIRNLLLNLIKSAKNPELSLHTGPFPMLFRQPTFFSSLFLHNRGVITRKTIRLVERRSILDFVKKNSSYLKGRVLDFGAGSQPYKDLISGEYVPYEKGDALPSGTFDAVLMTQVAQYLTSPSETFSDLAKLCKYLVMTYPTNWYEVEDTDLWRFTKVGMEKLLKDNGFEIIVHEPKCSLEFDGFALNIGYGVIAKSTHCL